MAGSVWVLETDDDASTLLEVADDATGVVRSIDLPDRGLRDEHVVVVSRDAVWVVHQHALVQRLGIADGTVRTISLPGGSHLDSAAVARDRLWIGTDRDRIYSLALETGELVDEHRGFGAREIVATPDGLWVTKGRTSKTEYRAIVAWLDGSGTIRHEVVLDGYPFSIARGSSDREVWVSTTTPDYAASSIYRVAMDEAPARVATADHRLSNLVLDGERAWCLQCDADEFVVDACRLCRVTAAGPIEPMIANVWDLTDDGRIAVRIDAIERGSAVRKSVGRCDPVAGTFEPIYASSNIRRVAVRSTGWSELDPLP